MKSPASHLTSTRALVFHRQHERARRNATWHLQESRFDSPCGELTVVTHEGRLVGLGFSDGDAPLRRSLARRFGATPVAGPAPKGVTRALDAYFGGDIGGARRHRRGHGRHAVPAARLAGAPAHPRRPDGAPTATSRGRSARPTRCARWARRTAPTRSASSSPAIASSPRTARSRATPTGSSASGGCCDTRAPSREPSQRGPTWPRGSRRSTGTRSDAASTTVGHAVTRPLLGAAECAALIRMYDDDRRFRSTVDMAPLPLRRGRVPLLRRAAAAARRRAPRAASSARLAPIANRWCAALGVAERYPADLARWLARCAAKGQQRPTPLLLRYVAGGFNCLHQDLYGALAFPLQVTIALSRARAGLRGRRVPARRAAPAGAVARRGDRARAWGGGDLPEPAPAGRGGAGVVSRDRAPRREPRARRRAPRARHHLPRRGVARGVRVSRGASLTSSRPCRRQPTRASHVRASTTGATVKGAATIVRHP